MKSMEMYWMNYVMHIVAGTWVVKHDWFHTIVVVIQERYNLMVLLLKTTH